jgi:hypothetical protein
MNEMFLFLDVRRKKKRKKIDAVVEAGRKASEAKSKLKIKREREAGNLGDHLSF